MPTVVGKRARVTMAGLLGLVMLVALTGCGGSSSKTTVLGGGGGTADVVVAKVDGLHTYSPNKLTIALNKDTIVHNVTIPDFAIDMDVQPGERIEVKLPAVTQAGRAGFFTFYCKYHQAEGEAGRIEVSR